jgi:hypothetical protein
MHYTVMQKICITLHWGSLPSILSMRPVGRTEPWDLRPRTLKALALLARAPSLFMVQIKDSSL